MKYKYKGYGKMTISSDGEIKTISEGDVVEFNDKEIEFQDLTLFEEIKEYKKKKEYKESEE